MDFQKAVKTWLEEAFGLRVETNKLERADRFIEESLELVQAVGFPKERVYALIEYVYSRPKGNPFQETGGVMLTLAGFCSAHDINMDKAGWDELDRVWLKIHEIRQKQLKKPSGSALPIDISNQLDLSLLNSFRAIIAKRGWQCREMTEELVQSAKSILTGSCNHD